MNGSVNWTISDVHFLLNLLTHHIKNVSRKPVKVNHVLKTMDIKMSMEPLQYMWDKYPIFVAKILNNSKISLEDIELAKRYY